MKKTVIVNIPMTIGIHKQNYSGNGSMMPASDRAVIFPVVSFLEASIKPEDEINCILICKHSEYSKSVERLADFRKEMDDVNEKVKAKISYNVIDSAFEEDGQVHEKLMNEIVEHIDTDSHIIVDMTYGPKDLPIVVFSALNFAEKFLRCSIDNIIYGQGFFNENHELVGAKMCDLSPLYSLNSLTNTLSCDDPEKAKKLLNSIISL